MTETLDSTEVLDMTMTMMLKLMMKETLDSTEVLDKVMTKTLKLTTTEMLDSMEVLDVATMTRSGSRRRERSGGPQGVRRRSMRCVTCPIALGARCV